MSSKSQEVGQKPEIEKMNPLNHYKMLENQQDMRGFYIATDVSKLVISRMVAKMIQEEPKNRGCRPCKNPNDVISCFIVFGVLNDYILSVVEVVVTKYSYCVFVIVFQFHPKPLPKPRRARKIPTDGSNSQHVPSNATDKDEVTSG